MNPVGTRAMARALVRGARAELDLTPKPGLVDLLDHGSHPDLDHATMVRSIGLLPLYYDELIAIRERGGSLPECVEAGRRAEARMMQAIGTNAHRGYIFLSGLVLLGACDDARPLREAIAGVAGAFFGLDPVGEMSRPGERIRRAHGMGGVRAEALAGLPSVFEVGLPAYRSARSHAAFHALASLMRVVEDTTAAARCGPDGLARVRADGRRLGDLLAIGDDPAPMLTALNREYSVMRLTMGGVADCVALVFALVEIH
jgi:triphosphoribosyl-dephospho-CoA synthase